MENKINIIIVYTELKKIHRLHYFLKYGKVQYKR